MQCKYCQAVLEEGNTVCPNCGESQEESKVTKRLKVLKILLASVVGLILLVLLVGLVHYGVTGSFLPKKNDLYYKNSYSISLEKLDTAAGTKSFQKKLDKVVATMGSHTLTNRQLQVYYWQLVNTSSYADLDKTAPLDAQYQDPELEKTWQHFFIEEAIKSWQQDMLLKDMAQTDGFAMPEDYASQFKTLEADLTTQAAQNGYLSVEAMLADKLGQGTNFETYYNYMWAYYLGALYWTDYMEGLEVSDAQIEEYFQSHEAELKTGYVIPITKDSGKLVDVRHILVMPEGGTKSEDGKTTVYSDAEWEACREKAQALLDEWLAGERTEESFGALAAEKTEDPGSQSSGGLYTYVYKGQMVEEFENWCFEEGRQAGDYGLVKTTYGYHVMYYVFGEDGWIRVCRDGAQAELSVALLEEKMAQNLVEVNYKNIVLAEVG